MGLDAVLTLGVVVAVVVVLARDWAPPAPVVLSATVALLLAGVIDAEQAFSGFSNAAPITVAALFVVARAVEVTGALEPLIRRLLGRGGTRRAQLSRLLLPTAAASAFLNNTPIVAMAVPDVADWAERNRVPASRLLMPLSYAAILGGVVTLIGTSTNLVVSGLLEEAGEPPLALFELTPVGLPLAAAGCVVIVALAPRLLPDRRATREAFDETVREFMVAMRVVEGGPLDGVSLEDGGLRHLQSVYCVGRERRGRTQAPVAPTEVLRGGDVLTFVGKVDEVVDLQRMRGLTSTEARHLDGLGATGQTFFEAVVGAQSALVGKTMREVAFRERYQAAVLAVHRAGQRLDAKLGEVPLRLGDTLLLLADPGFGERWRESGDFLLIAQLRASPPARGRKAPVVGLVVLGIVVVAGAGLVPILEASLAGALALVALRAVTVREARQAIDLDVLVVIAAAFGLSAAVSESGLADGLANVLLTTFGPLGPLGTLLGLLLATMALTELLTNNAAAVLLLPIGLATASALGVDPRPFAITVALGASLSFLTPIGYQTNLMVYGPGGYRFGDYARLGLPLNVVVVALVLLLVPRFFPF